MNSYRIFMVEDDEEISRLVSGYLTQWGYIVRCAKDFSDILTEFSDFDPQLVLLDISLPFFNGYHWCSLIRQISKVPVLFLSSASDDMNIIMAMNMGGDDFIAKPFEPAVLTAKIQALLRRTYDFGMPAHLLECAGAILNIEDATLSSGDVKTELTKNEMKILQMLFENKGRIVSRDLLMARLWESDEFVDENTLTVNITRLRKKLAEAGLPELIHTKKGIGYMAQ